MQQDAINIIAHVWAAVTVCIGVPRAAVDRLERVVSQRNVVHPQASFKEAMNDVVRYVDPAFAVVKHVVFNITP